MAIGKQVVYNLVDLDEVGEIGENITDIGDEIMEQMEDKKGTEKSGDSDEGEKPKSAKPKKVISREEFEKQEKKKKNMKTGMKVAKIGTKFGLGALKIGLAAGGIATDAVDGIEGLVDIADDVADGLEQATEIVGKYRVHQLNTSYRIL